MKKIIPLLTLLVASSVVLFAQNSNTRIFTIFTSKGCGCTGSGGPPAVFETHEVVMDKLNQACSGIDFLRFEGTISEGYQEVEEHQDKYDGVLIIGRMDGDYRLGFTGLPTIIVYNLWEFQSAKRVGL